MFIIFRSSHKRCSVKKGVLKKFTNFMEKHLCWSLFLLKLQATTLLERNCNTCVFLWNLRNFLKTPILKNICERLVLYFHYNSHHHYHYDHHFHYHCKMRLYHLRILLTIPLDYNIMPCLFQLNFVFFLPAYILL